MDWQALALTLKLAAVTTAILLALAVPLAALLVLGRSRWLAALEALAALPLVLPPTVLGFFLLVMLGPRTPVGRGITAILGHPLAFSFSGLVVGSVIYSLPFAVQPLVAGGELSWTQGSTGSGSCTLTCHGQKHDGFGY